MARKKLSHEDDRTNIFQRSSIILFIYLNLYKHRILHAGKIVTCRKKPRVQPNESASPPSLLAFFHFTFFSR